MSYDFLKPRYQNADYSPRGPAVSESDVRLQRELVRQQQELLQQQQEQLSQSQKAQAQALKQQEKLCDQIRQLGETLYLLESSSTSVFSLLAL